MRTSWLNSVARAARPAALAMACALLAACSSSGDKVKPTELAPDPGLLKVRSAWSTRIGDVGFPMSATVAGSAVVLAAGDGSVIALEAASGRELWRGSAGEPLSAGVGSDGTTSAVVTRGNELVAIRGGKEAWRRKLPAQVYTSPFVAGERVFVLAADRSVTGFDAGNGARLWTLTRPGEPLVLRQQGVILAVGDTLVAGLSGRLVGINPISGSVRWEAPIASPRGVNEVERLVDLVGSVSRVGDSVCARAFQSAVGCVNAARGVGVWSKPANASEGVNGDDKMVFGAEFDGKLVAWKRENGERAWTNERLLHRGLRSPLVAGKSVAVADNTGFIHFVSRDDGKLLTRVATDGSPLAAAPVMASGVLVAVTRNGGVFGFVAE